MKYKCLVLDHDDTTVESTKYVHYPSFMKVLNTLRPDVKISLDDYYRLYCEYGLHKYETEVLGFSDEELQYEKDEWMKYVADHVPKFFDGMDDIIKKQKEEGGYVCVVSHSVSKNIIRDYERAGLPVPDMIFGSELPPEKVKPSIYPIEKIKEEFNLDNGDILVVDDLMMGHQMAVDAKVDFICATWAHDIPEIRKYFTDKNVELIATPMDLYNLQFMVNPEN